MAFEAQRGGDFVPVELEGCGALGGGSSPKRGKLLALKGFGGFLGGGGRGGAYSCSGHVGGFQWLWMVMVKLPVCEGWFGRI